MASEQNVLKAVVKGHLTIVETRNVHYYGCFMDSPNWGDVATQVHTMLSGMYTDLSATLAQALAFYEIEYFRKSEAQWFPVSVHTFVQTGALVDDISSYQTAALVTARTSVLRAIGKKFIPGISETRTVGGAIGSILATALLSYAADYITPVDDSAANTWVPGVVSKNSAFAPFVSASVGTILSTMRRRKPGYGI